MGGGANHRGLVAFEPDRCVLAVPARADELARVRAVTRSWLATQDLDDPLVTDVLIAVGEACANVVEHAYDDDRGTMEIELARERSGDLVARIRDWGTWRVDRPEGGSRDGRGRGTAMMRAVTADFRRATAPGGTVVTFRFATGGRDGQAQGRA